MGAQDAIGGLVRQQLDEPVGGEIGLGAAVAHETELADLVGHTVGFQLFFGLAHAGDLGVGVDHAWDDAIVHMAMFARDHLGRCHALVLGLVGQHRALDRVANGIDAGNVGTPLGVGGDLAALGHLHAQRFQPQPVGKGLAAGGDQHHLGLGRVFAAVLAQGIGNLCLGFQRLDLRHRRPKGKVQALLGQQFLELFLHLAVQAGGDGVQVFDHLHIRAQPGIDAAHLQPDHARADHHHGFRDLAQRQRAGRGDHGLFIHRHLGPGDRGRLGPAGDDDVFRLVGGVTDRDLARRGDAAPALEPVDLVLLEQEFDALGVLADHVVLVGQHLFPVDLGRRALQAHLFEIVLRLVQLVAGVQQRLGRDAAHVQAGAAQGFAPLDAGGFQAQLGAADRGDIAAGAGADDDDIVVGHGSGPSGLRGRGALPPVACGDSPRSFMGTLKGHQITRSSSMATVAAKPANQITLRQGAQPKA